LAHVRPIHPPFYNDVAVMVERVISAFHFGGSKAIMVVAKAGIVLIRVGVVLGRSIKTVSQRLI
jgi:hypothetical protein